MALPGLFESSPFARPLVLSGSSYIKAMHPKAEISPEPTAIRKVLKLGWVGQIKIHGHRAQFHISHDTAVPIKVFNRQGMPHQRKVSAEISAELRRVFQPSQGFTVLDAEWRKEENKIYVFDILKLNGQALRSFTYRERWELLPRVYKSSIIETLDLIRSYEKCIAVLNGAEDYIEGLVFKALDSPGFDDTSIVRCRRRAVQQ